MVAFDVQPLPGRKMGFSGREDRVEVTWSQDYRVEVTGTPEEIAAVDEVTVMTQPELPVVNRSVYELADGRILPFVICRDKAAQQDPKRRSRWTVKTKFRSKVRSASQESENQPIDPPASVTDIAPKETVDFGDIERVIYIDKSTPKKPILTPLKHFYAEPTVEKISDLTIKLTQHEASVSYEQLLERRWRANETPYRGQLRYAWLITDIEPNEVEIIIDDGSGPAPQTVALVTYTLVFNPLPNGWKDERALIDTHFIEDGKIKPFSDGTMKTKNYGFIKADGTKKTPTAQDPGPDYDVLERFETIDFAAFLRA